MKRFPRRPRGLVKKARALAARQFEQMSKIGLPNASNPVYVAWLRNQSMLEMADKLARRYSGTGAMWQNPYGIPRPQRALQQSSVWYTAYPLSLMTGSGESMIGSLASDELWKAFRQVGITGIHTGPMKIAGGIEGWKFTPSVDGHFDRIGNSIDQVLGTEADFVDLIGTARRNGAIVIDDIVPGHTGKGADFRLAEMNHSQYPGIYHMVNIKREDWEILPHVPKGKDSVNATPELERELKNRGYIIGRLQRVIFFEPDVKETNWSVTGPIRGVDGVTRRWVYLHYFWDGQPTLNWLDPSFAAMRLVIGDAVHSLDVLGTRGLRLDANGFLGAEISEGSDYAWSEGHPLSLAANQIIASTVRKLGGFTFQEVNLSIDDIKSTSTYGADLSYDFITRPAYHHALATGDTEFLKLMIQESLRLGVQPASLVHALQNHDELTYELVHLWTTHADDRYTFRGQSKTGAELRDIIRSELRDAIVSSCGYNKLFTENGIACTMASMIAAIRGNETTDNLSGEEISMIRRAHLLLAMFNAWQPGVFAVSGWDLVGALTLPDASVSAMISAGDTRWINRGAYDLTGRSAGDESASGMPRARSLYGSLPAQLDDPESFASCLRGILAVRTRLGVDQAVQLGVADSDAAILALVHRLTDNRLQITVLNFTGQPFSGRVASDFFPPGAKLVDESNDTALGKVSSAKDFVVDLEAYGGKCIVIG